jgi:hypothetical protein
MFDAHSFPASVPHARAAWLLSILMLASCAREAAPPSTPPPQVSDVRTVGPFHSVRNHSSAQLRVSNSPEHKLTVTCSAEVLKGLNSAVEEEILLLSPAEGAESEAFGACTIDLSAPRLQEIVSSGSGNLSATTELDGNARIEVTGSGDVTLASLRADRFVVDWQGSGEMKVDSAQVKELYVRVAGSGSLDIAGLESVKIDVMAAMSTDTRLSGTAEGLVVVHQGSGQLDASKLIAKHAAVTSRRTGDSTVHATESVNAALLNSGDIRVLGKPSKRQANSTGSGSLSYE